MLALLILPLAIGIASARYNIHARDGTLSGNNSLACFFMTSDVNWQGEQLNLCEWGGVCAGALPDGLNANVSSAGPSEGQTCFLYTAEDCGGKASEAISYPGYADLSAIGFMKKAKSWRCYKWSGFTSSASVITTTTTMTTGTMARASAQIANAMGVSITTTKSGTQSTANSVDVTTTKSGSPSTAATSVDVTTVTTTTTVDISTTKTAGQWTNGSAAALFGTGNVGTISMTHTYGGRGSNWTTLTTYVAGGTR